MQLTGWDSDGDGRERLDVRLRLNNLEAIFLRSRLIGSGDRLRILSRFYDFPKRPTHGVVASQDSDSRNFPVRKRQDWRTRLPKLARARLIRALKLSVHQASISPQLHRHAVQRTRRPPPSSSRAARHCVSNSAPSRKVFTAAAHFRWARATDTPKRKGSTGFVGSTRSVAQVFRASADCPFAKADSLFEFGKSRMVRHCPSILFPSGSQSDHGIPGIGP